jgi:hypothetical protein
MTLVGHHLTADSVTILCTNRSTRVTNEITVSSGNTEEEIPVTIPDEPAAWPAGHYTIEAVLHDTDEDEEDRTTNTLAFTLAPQLTTPTDSIDRTNGRVTFSVTCRPQIRDDQQAVLLFGGRPVRPDAITTPTLPGTPPQPPDLTASTTLTFTVNDVASGDVWLRLRVDGVDSLLIDFSTDPPTFDTSQKVTIA